jgi:hypothetical protein
MGRKGSSNLRTCGINFKVARDEARRQRVFSSGKKILLIYYFFVGLLFLYLSALKYK